MILDNEGLDLHSVIDLKLNFNHVEGYNKEIYNEINKRFYQLLKNVDELVWDSCQNHTRLSVIS